VVEYYPLWFSILVFQRERIREELEILLMKILEVRGCLAPALAPSWVDLSLLCIPKFCCQTPNEKKEGKGGK
jgi:hypothetical protein